MHACVHAPGCAERGVCITGVVQAAYALWAMTASRVTSRSRILSVPTSAVDTGTCGVAVSPLGKGVLERVEKGMAASARGE